MRKPIRFAIIGLALAAVLAACGKTKDAGEYSNEIITTTPVDQDKTMITVRVEFGAGQEADLETKLEEEFPDIDIVLRHDGSNNSRYTIKANLEAEVECDLIFSRRLPTIKDKAGEYLLDLSGEDFVDNYYITAVDTCADSDGHLYYLPGVSDVYGIVYDKTMFEENNWEVPHSYSEFADLVATIRKSGIKHPIQVSMMYSDVFQIMFNTYGYEDALGGTDNYLWLLSYQNGNETMVGHMEGAVEKFTRLFDDGILSISDWSVTPSERSAMLYSSHDTAMIVECQRAVDYIQSYTEGQDEEDRHEIAMMPFWISDEEDSDYLYCVPSYYLAINKKSAEESKEKKRILLDIYAYLSSIEGQKTLFGNGLQVSNIQGVMMEDNEFSDEIVKTIEEGRLIQTFSYANGGTERQVEAEMLSTARDMVQGKMGVEEWLLAADQARDEALFGAKEQEEVYGEVETTMTRLETAYTVAQMYRELTGADIGICYGGSWDNGTNGYFYQGDITDDSLECVNPNKEPKEELEDDMDEKIVVASLTGKTILEILNSEGKKEATKGFCPYYVASGLVVEFAPWAGTGNRVVSCKLPNGDELSEDETYTVAYFNGSLPEDVSALPERALDGTWKENFLTYLEQQDGVLKKPEMEITLVYD